jgi:hypothetical protein
MKAAAPNIANTIMASQTVATRLNFETLEAR